MNKTRTGMESHPHQQPDEEKYHNRVRGERQRYGLNRLECVLRRLGVRASYPVRA